MKMLFKLYLLGQLIAMPFMVGAVGDVLSSGSESAPTASLNQTAAQRTLTAQDLCDSLHGTVLNSVQDDIQQLRYITADLYDEDIVEDCFSPSN